MNLKNIILNTAELGHVDWKDVEKLQPNNKGYICFISAEVKYKTSENGEEQPYLLGTYFQTPFMQKPTYKQVINFVINSEYPDGKENKMLRLGVYDPNDEEFLAYYNNCEDIRLTIKQLLN